ncbi:beta-N-acetylhexosaminidase [Alicyclobacillus fastidiosus]|uniref:beta-N-acetylhexosaminidase n=1 Tax=Alicyclobacillus fastidiosus TaxID=392011 RepID=A0ABY6ZF30_9BACL|nr:glycoside hydrolase family 20 zincin-like fold domain-containing protein [Alicyclobacillus fastidiosus]WAH41509.1 beta-N-acetylhexosaminidase [Alicyclobacillus fastidiosus]GMA63158.1 hypothetical protein GCM10025859_35980 [Alicyclobacillus fastidiosus]
MVGQSQKKFVCNPDFTPGATGTKAADGWSINPETTCDDYAVELAAGPTGETGHVQIVRGKGRSAEYVWQKIDVRGEPSLTVRGWVKTVGDTTAQLRLFFMNRQGKLLKRAMSSHVLSETEWTLVELHTRVPEGSTEGTLFAISFTSGGLGESRWWSVDVRDGSPTEEAWTEDSRANDGRRTDLRAKVIPTPKEVNWGTDQFQISPESTLCVLARSGRSAIRACGNLQEVLTGRLGVPLNVRTDFDMQRDSTAVIATLAEDLQELRDLTGLDIPPVPEHKEGYIVYISKHLCVCAANTERGLFYATQTVIQMFPSEGDLVLPTCTIRDWPELPERCVHIFVDFLSLQHMRELIGNVIGRLKFNTVVLECSMTRWLSHPEIWQPEAGTRANLRAVQQMLQDAYVDVIPLIQSLGHSAWLFCHGRNMDICEDTSVPYAYNPLAPRTYEVLFEIYQEAIDLLRPSAFHIGHDEVRMVGEFPKSNRGKGIGFSSLFVEDVRKIAKFLTDQGIRPWMWADVAFSPDVAGEISKLPPDIVMVDWQYVPFRQYVSTEQLMKAGFDVVGATWWNPRNICTFAKYAATVGAKGMMQTTWIGHFASVKWPLEIHQYIAHVHAAQSFWAVQADEPGAEFDQAADRFIRAALTTWDEAAMPEWADHW